MAKHLHFFNILATEIQSTQRERKPLTNLIKGEGKSSALCKGALELNLYQNFASASSVAD
jgi:hypothetical protein